MELAHRVAELFEQEWIAAGEVVYAAAEAKR